MINIPINSDICTTYAYSHDDGVCQDQSKWMSALKDSTPLSSLSIPGTHDSMSLGWGGDIAQTQSKTLPNQLSSGVRFLDIRLAAYPKLSDLLYSYHGFIYLHSTFQQILDTITNFLTNNPTETIIMRLKQEYTTETDATFISLLQKFLKNPKYSDYIYNYAGNKNPILKNLRRKILILQNFGGNISWMLYNQFVIQDNYNLNTNWDLYNKWTSIKSQLVSANQSFLQNNSQRFINFLSGSGGVFPYFVASGHINPATNAPNLSTGLTEPVFKSYYTDFPRVNWVGIFATINFKGTNYLTKDYIDNNKPSYVGIIPSNFPGQGLINSIINVNFK